TSLRIRDVVNTVMLGRQLLRRGRFALLSIFVEGLPDDATRETVRVEVGGFGSRPIHVIPTIPSFDPTSTRLNRLAAPGNPVEPAWVEAARTCSQIITPVPPGLNAERMTLRVLHGDLQSAEFPICLSESGEW